LVDAGHVKQILNAMQVWAAHMKKARFEEAGFAARRDCCET
jgi:hypothetical protein